MPHSLFAFAAALTLTTTLSLSALARPPAPPPPDDARNSTTTIQGTVERYLLNPFGEVDGLLLQDGTQVHFPPHLSRALTEAVKPGTPVRIDGDSESRGVIRAENVENTQTRARIANVPPNPDSPPPQRAALNRMQASGQVSTMLSGPRGEVNGVILNEGTIVRFPPRIADRFETLLRPGQSLAVSGYGSKTPYGDVLEATDLGTDPSAMRPLYETRPDRAPPPPQDADPGTPTRPRRP
jgi:hypothetical protein